jgi:hypothetical protein
MASPLPLQHANTVYYVGEFRFLPDRLESFVGTNDSKCSRDVQRAFEGQKDRNNFFWSFDDRCYLTSTIARQA